MKIQMKIREIKKEDRQKWIKLVQLTDNRNKEWAEQNQLKLLFLPKYSPDLNYIEMCWGQIKHNIQSKECKSLDEKKKLSKSTWKEFSIQNQIPYMKNKINTILKSKGDYLNK